jgi:hypothetical protein
LTGPQALSTTGIGLTLAGGVVLIYRDLHPKERIYAEVLSGFRRQEASIGFPSSRPGQALEILGITSL